MDLIEIIILAVIAIAGAAIVAVYLDPNSRG